MNENNSKLQINRNSEQLTNESSLKRDIQKIGENIDAIEKEISDLETKRAMELGDLSEEKNYDIFFYIGGALVLLNLIFNFNIAGLVIAIVFGGMFFVYKKYFQKDRIRELFGYSVWSFLIQIGDQLRFRLDSYVIGWALGAAFVTHFAIGANLANYLKNIIFKATNFLTPLFTKYYAEKNFNEIKKKLLLTTKINSILSVFGGGIIIRRNFIL